MGVRANEISQWSIEHWGTVDLESRLFFDEPLYAGQKRNDLSLTLKPTLYFEGSGNGSFTFTPFLKVDGSDSKRTHADIREAYYLTYGFLDDIEWELRLGIDQVFWGTAESNHLVNIVNQTDLVDDSGGDEKLGQPMIHGTLSGEWGTLDLFVLPFHRPRTFPGSAGRLRSAIPIETNKSSIKYEHSSGRRHIDLAARFSNSIGPLDFGVSAFRGTSREPHLTPVGSPPVIVQNYNLIEQVGLDLQLTLGAFLGKAELRSRNGFAETGSDKVSHNAFVVGGEYSIYGIFESDADLTLLAEWSQDERRGQASASLQNDVFVAARYALNDIGDTNMTAAIVDDLDYDTRTLSLEFNRRLTDSASLSLEAFKFLSKDMSDLSSWQIRNDDHLAVQIRYSF